jgi:hypothetical protein
MKHPWQQIAGEFGRAFGVLALLVLTLLAPIHASAEARLAMGDRSGLSILCLPAEQQSDPAKGTTVASCDLCVLAHVAKALGPAAGFAWRAPERPASAPVRPPVLGVDASAALVFLPDARGPPRA